MDKKIKVAVIGVGSISGEHISAYLKNPNVELYAFCDINAQRLKDKGEKYNVTRLYTDVNEMLSALPEIDAVSVCVWNNAHASCSIAALNAGKHVLCEKPMAMNAKEAQEMLDTAKKNGKKLMVLSAYDVDGSWQGEILSVKQIAAKCMPSIVGIDIEIRQISSYYGETTATGSGSGVDMLLPLDSLVKQGG